MKILVKKEVCGSCEQCMGPTRKDRKALLKKKKKKKAQSTDAQRYHQYPNKYLVVEICVCVCG